MFGFGRRFLTKKMGQIDLYKDMLNFKALTGFDFYDFIMLFKHGILEINAPNAHNIETLKKAIKKLGAKEVIKANYRLQKLEAVEKNESNRIGNGKKEFKNQTNSSGNEK